MGAAVGPLLFWPDSEGFGSGGAGGMVPCIQVVVVLDLGGGGGHADGVAGVDGVPGGGRDGAIAVQVGLDAGGVVAPGGAAGLVGWDRAEPAAEVVRWVGGESGDPLDEGVLEGIAEQGPVIEEATSNQGGVGEGGSATLLVGGDVVESTPQVRFLVDLFPQGVE